MDRHELYRPLLERTLENYQIQHLARKYDFGRQSLVSRLIVERINSAMDEAEESIGILRVKPFCLYIKNKDGQAALPLFSPSYLEPLLEGRSYNAARSRVVKELFKIYKKSFRKSLKGDLLSIINPWSQVRSRGIKNYKKNLARKPFPYPAEDSLKWGRFVADINPVSPLKRLDVLDSSAPEKVLEKLTRFVKEEAGFGNILARQLVEDIVTIRAAVCPRTSRLKSGEMPMLLTHVSAKLSEDTATRYRKLSPVIITVLSKEELKGFPDTMDDYLPVFAKRILRICFEAYKQNGLLTLQEMQWIFMVSATRISEVVRSAEYRHNIIVPTPGTVLDAGRSITHKDIIVKLHLEGHNVSDISKITYHSPRSIDSYIGTFEAVLILYLYKMPVCLMSRILGKGKSLIREHLRLIEEVYSDVNAIKKDLIKKGIRF
jgi:hypothetical protein